jgi:hypothetical protein
VPVLESVVEAGPIDFGGGSARRGKLEPCSEVKVVSPIPDFMVELFRRAMREDKSPKNLLDLFKTGKFAPINNEINKTSLSRDWSGDPTKMIEEGSGEVARHISTAREVRMHQGQYNGPMV